MRSSGLPGEYSKRREDSTRFNSISRAGGKKKEKKFGQCFKAAVRWSFRRHLRAGRDPPVCFSLTGCVAAGVFRNRWIIDGSRPRNLGEASVCTRDGPPEAAPETPPFAPPRTVDPLRRFKPATLLCPGKRTTNKWYRPIVCVAGQHHRSPLLLLLPLLTPRSFTRALYPVFPFLHSLSHDEGEVLQRGLPTTRSLVSRPLCVHQLQLRLFPSSGVY